MKNVCNWTALFLILLTGLTSSRVAHGTQEIDDIEWSLSQEIVKNVELELAGSPLSQADRGYAYFLLAVYKHDPLAREKAERIYKEMKTPESQAFLGSIEMLKARDLKSSGVFGNLLDIFKKRRHVLKGIETIDKAAAGRPANLDIKLVRAVTYLELPAFFGKLKVGFEDMKTLIRWIEEGKITVPDRETLFRDKSSLYYYAGRYFLKMSQSDQAKEVFLKSIQSSGQSPFATASRKRLSR